MNSKKIARGVALGVSAACALSVVAGDADPQTPIADQLENASEHLRLYNDHLTTLANPAMEGRVPGSRGMEMAKQYCEYWLEQIGLEPAFDLVQTAEDGTEVVTLNGSYRQAFPLAGTLEAVDEKLRVGDIEFTPGEDFNILGLGGSNDLTLPLVFVGYSIDNGAEGYSSYAEDDEDSLEGKIAVMFRFEPMNEEGASLWNEGGGWSNEASFNNKLRGAWSRGAAAAIIINPPECSDPRSGTLMGVGGSGSGTGEKPVLMMTPEAGERLIGAVGDGRTLLEYRRSFDEGTLPIELGAEAHVVAEIEADPLIGENVAGILRGKGPLAEEYIVVGAHLDHLGMGYFGSRTGGGTLHPGADDNASGSAGVLLFAQMMADSYAKTETSEGLRSVVFMLFSGEESGLHGSRYYVNNPVGDIENHAFMINFDMIGRIQEGRVTVAGKNTAEGLAELIQPHIENTRLTVNAPERMSGASDHSSFYAMKIPVLFGAITDFHGDYHTPEDVSWKINRKGAVDTIALFHDIAMDIAQRTEGLEYKEQPRGGGGGGMGNIKVRFGVMPGYSDDGEGVLIEDVTDGSSAGEAGVLGGDRLVRWDGKKVVDMNGWMELLGEHEPGDEIKVEVIRDDEKVTLDVTLQAR